MRHDTIRWCFVCSAIASRLDYFCDVSLKNIFKRRWVRNGDEISPTKAILVLVPVHDLLGTRKIWSRQSNEKILAVIVLLL